jgi:hypothetical protein
MLIVILTYTPLLSIQRQIQGMPRNAQRFNAYLNQMLTPDRTGVVYPPLVLMNPMGKDHVTALLDDLLALDADDIAADATAEMARELADAPGEYRIALVIVDDLLGGWTNRYATEMNLRFPAEPKPGKPRWLHDAWLTGVLWSSEPASARAVREAIRTTLFRHAYLDQHGYSRTLREMLAQEGKVLSKSGCTTPTLDKDDLEYTRTIIAPMLDTQDRRTAQECLFGDAAARTLGFTPQGLSPWAGLALALHDARCAEQACRVG